MTTLEQPLTSLSSSQPNTLLELGREFNEEWNTYLSNSPLPPEAKHAIRIFLSVLPPLIFWVAWIPFVIIMQKKV